MTDEEFKRVVEELAGPDPYWNVPTFEIVKQIINMPYGVVFSIGELSNNTKYHLCDTNVEYQTQICGLVRDVCKRLGILLEAVRDEEERFVGMPANYKFKKIEK